MKKSLFMENTQIDALKTVSEIQAFLVQAGASTVMSTYDDQRNITGLHFVVQVSGQPVPFQLPIRIDPIFKIINGRRKPFGQNSRTNKTFEDREQSRRVAWRQLYRWVQAQLALIETGMVTTPEVFSPYIQTGPNETLYQKIIAGGFQRLLPAQGETL